MSGQWTWYLYNYPGAQGSLTPMIQDVATLPIFMSPYFSGSPQALIQNKNIFLLHVHHRIQGSMVPVSPGVPILSRCHPQQHTQKNPQFMERPNASQKRLLSLFPGSQGITFGSYNPKNKNIKGPENSSSLEIITTFPLHPSTPTQDGRGMKWNSSWSMGTDARRGHTHQSVHSLRRTRALQAAHSSCSC